VAQCAGLAERAAEPLRESLDLFRKHADPNGQAQALIALGRLASQQQRAGEAPLLLHEGLTLAQAVSDPTTVATGLVETAALLADRARAREWKQAARLLGAAAAILQAGDGRASPHESARFDQQQDIVQSALGDTAFPTARAAGRALTLEQAVAEALQAMQALARAWQ
jgi:hypothetical protein